LKRFADDDYEAEWKFFLPEEGFNLVPNTTKIYFGLPLIRES
jgi:hypothetical protein